MSLATESSTVVPYKWETQTYPSWDQYTFYPWVIYRTCPKCKRQVSYYCNDPYTHCPYCGANLSVCPHCGKPLHEDC